MAKIYLLMVGKKRVTDFYYYDKEYVVSDAEYIAEDTGETVEIWEAEDLEDIPLVALDWTRVGVYGLLTKGDENKRLQ